MGKTTPRDTDWIANAPLQIRREAVIEADAAWVWAQLADNEGFVDWFPGFRECRWTSSAPHGVGSTRFVHQDQFKVDEKIIQWVPGERWGMTVVSMNLPVLSSMAEDIRLTPTGSSTTVNFDIGVHLTRMARPLQGVLKAKTASNIEKALANLNERARQRQ